MPMKTPINKGIATRLDAKEWLPFFYRLLMQHQKPHLRFATISSFRNIYKLKDVAERK
jgi:hypothetical protein